MSEPVLDVRDLTIEVAEPGGPRALVQGLSLSIARGEILGVVGESGSGKTLSAFAIAGLLPPRVRVAGGEIHLAGRRIDALSDADRRPTRGRDVGVVFQDPLSSFNPVRTIGSMLIESAQRHQRTTESDARDRAIQSLRQMRLPGENASVDCYPHMLSGGQRQRAMIALALINRPALLIADEPTTALDPTVQLQILALLKREAADRGCLLITHDLSVAAAICHRIAVMKDGRLLEQGPTDRLLTEPEHPFTRDLIASAPSRRSLMAAL